MEKVNTVLGPVDPDALGLTLCHEHIIASYPGWECDPLTRPYNREQIVKTCIKRISPVKKHGVKTVIDATPVDLARDVDVMKAVSEQLEIHIVCSTGRYTEAEGKWAYFKLREKSRVGEMETELYDGMMHEITNGIGQTGVKPGAIKLGTGYGEITACEEAAFRAAARACRETGIPILTHTQDGTMGPEQATLLTGEGVPPEKIMIGHMCGNPSMQYLMDVLDTGVYIAFDRFGLEMFVSDQVRTAMLIGLLGTGYAGRIMLSHDFMACSHGRGGIMPKEEAEKIGINWSFSHIFVNILPAMEKAGITKEQIQTMMVENPKNFLAGK